MSIITAKAVRKTTHDTGVAVTVSVLIQSQFNGDMFTVLSRGPLSGVPGFELLFYQATITYTF